MHADVLVVGAGPAGSIAALVLARAGVAVRLLDRATFPREKLCGDTLNPGTLAILDRLGLGSAIRQRAQPISGMTVTGPGGAAVAADYPFGLHGAAIMRRDLDLALLEAASAAGASFQPGANVLSPVIDERGHVGGVRVASSPAVESTLRARVVIAAEGRASRLGAALKLSAFAPAPRRWAFGAYFDGIAGLTTRGEMHLRPGGYVGIAPLPGGIANVCAIRELAAPGAARGIDTDRVILDATSGDPVLRHRFGNARRVSPLSSLGPLAVNARAAGCPGLLLAGDAAGFVDPMTGDGMRFALRGGELAAQAALRELASGAPACCALHRTRKREFAGKWRVNRALRAIVGSPRALDCAAAMTAWWDAPVRYLIGLAGDIALATTLTDDDTPRH